MPKFMIERDIPKAGQFSSAELQGIAAKSCGVLSEMTRAGTDIQWIHSYVTGDKIYCVYSAPTEEAVRTHATRGGFPANRIERVYGIIDPTTSE